jgi:5,10-methylenetetrahydromethanopterin reductase
MLSMPGTMLDLAGHIRAAQQAENAGFAAAWLPQVFALDALTVLALAGRETSRIALGTAVVPTYPRHPVVLAQQALSAQAACGGRLLLGIGLSHKVVIEGMLGLDYSRPIGHMREYLTVLNSLLGGEAAALQGDLYRVNARLAVPEAARPPLLVAALGPAMLKLSGSLADGTVTWMGGVAYLRDVAVPTIRHAAAQAGRPAPRVVCMAPVCVADDADAARAAADAQFAGYGQLPSYRATLDRGGAAGPGEVALAGDEASVTEQLRAYADAGVTDFACAPYALPGETTARTLELLASLARGVTE